MDGTLADRIKPESANRIFGVKRLHSALEKTGKLG
jgi:hypothetical protein